MLYQEVFSAMFYICLILSGSWFWPFFILLSYIVDAWELWTTVIYVKWLITGICTDIWVLSVLLMAWLVFTILSEESWWENHFASLNGWYFYTIAFLSDSILSLSGLVGSWFLTYNSKWICYMYRIEIRRFNNWFIDFDIRSLKKVRISKE